MNLFSKAHIEHQKKVHQDCPSYGETSLIFAPMVSELIESNNVKDLLDYGAGQGKLASQLQLSELINIQVYDPAFESHKTPPQPAEMVVCLDVLDNVESDKVDLVLDDLCRLTKRIGFFSINTTTGDDLGDTKQNTSKTIRPVEWWLPKLLERFELHYFSRISLGFVVVVKNKTEQ